MCKDCGCSMGNHSHHDHTHHHDHPALNEKKTVEVVTKILQENDHEAAHNRAHLDEYGLLCVNLMSSPGAGKTTLLEATIKSSGLRVGVVEGDLETNMDANRIINAGGKAHQISTGQTCHLDAFMVHNGLHHLPLKELDLVFIENVDFDINEVKKEAKKLNPKVDIIEVDSKTGLGIDKWINYLKMKKELK